MFDSRKDAGRQIGEALVPFSDRTPLILGIPRGGVIIAAEAARYVKTEFSLLIARKLPFPHNPEAGFGAIAEDGTTIILHEAASYIGNEHIERIQEEQKKEIERRINVLRGGNALPPLQNRTVVLTDDGIAMGSTMRAAIGMCRNSRAAEVIVAVPVCSPRVRQLIEKLTDHTIVLESPERFRAVAQVYRHWYDVGDEEVRSILSYYQG